MLNSPALLTFELVKLTQNNVNQEMEGTQQRRPPHKSTRAMNDPSITRLEDKRGNVNTYLRIGRSAAVGC